MRQFACAIATVALLGSTLVSGEVRAVTGGDLSVLTKGQYTCELPGNASDPDLFAGTPQPDSDFEIIGDSSYRAKGVRGTYLMTGDKVHFTTGTLDGRQFHKVAPTFLRAVNADGTDGDLRCVSSSQGLPAAPGDDSRCKRAAKNKVAMRKRDSDLAC